MPEPSHAPSATPTTAPASADDQAQLHVVPADLAVRVAERLERGDLLALHRHDAREDHVQEERRDGEEDDRQDEPDALQLRQLVVEIPVRHLQRSRESRRGRRTASSSRSSRAITSGSPAPGSSVSARSLKPPSMSNAAARPRPSHPEHAEARVVRHQLARDGCRRCTRATARCRRSPARAAGR